MVEVTVYLSLALRPATREMIETSSAREQVLQ